MSYSSSEIKYWLGFSRISGIGRARIALLISYFGGLQQAWKAPDAELKSAGLDESTVNSIIASRKKISLDDEIESINRYQIKVIPYLSDNYPRLLIESGDYPPLLYVRGNINEQDACSLAVVGTRRATTYGKQVTEELVTEISRLKITIVSGLAKGIDAIAHRAALEANGRTLAVFASGLDIVYPPENLKLAREIMESGALISEYPLGTKPKPENFPRRNRILSGLSRGVLIVECGDSSGALITANFAVEQNREVFAVPGSVFAPMSRGPNKLIQEGAKLVRNHIDILEELNISFLSEQLEMKETIAADETEMRIVKCLSSEPVHIDEICRSSGLNASVVSSTITIMELNGLVRQVSNMCYALKNSIR